MICTYCATSMPEISAFCPRCGRSVRVERHDAADAYAVTDIRESILGASAYLTVIPAIVFLLIPALRNNRFVRFHSWQSICFAIATAILSLAVRLLFVVFSIVPIVGFLLAWLSLGIGFLAVVTLWAVMVTKASQGHSYELPVIGPIAARLAG